MRGERSKNYPPSGRMTLDGGKNNKFFPTLIDDSESPDCANVVFTDQTCETRPGTAKLNTASVGTFACKGLWTRHARGAGESMVAAFGSSVFALSGTTFNTIAGSENIFGTVDKINAVEYENQLFFGNGVSNPYKYNGTNFTRHGIPAPTSAPLDSSFASGLLTGSFTYKITFVNSALVEGNPSPATVTLVVASATIRLTTLPIAPASFGVNARRIYRNTAADPSTWLRVATISDNTTSFYSDNAADLTLGVEVPDDNGVPPTWSQAIYHRNRLFMIDPNTPGQVSYTDLGNPYVVGALSFVPLGDNSGDVAQGLGIYNDSLIVMCKRTPFAIDMPSDDDAEWRVRELVSPFGTAASRAIVKFDNKLLFPAMQNGKMVGFAALSGSGVSQTTTTLRLSVAGSYLMSDRIEPDMFALPDGQVDEMAAIVYQNRIYLAVPYGEAQTANNRIYLYDFSNENLSKRNFGSWVPWTGLNAAMFTIYNGTLYYGASDAVGFVYEMGKEGVANANDSGAAIDSYIYTKEYVGDKGEDRVTKDFRWANIFYETLGDFAMQFGWKVDGDTGVGNTQDVNLNPGGSLWGTMIWGIDDWGGGLANNEARAYLERVRGKRIQFYFNNKNTVGRRFKIIGLDFRYNSGNER